VQDEAMAGMARERGHIMAGVLVLLAIMLIFSTVIFQSWEEVLRRDNEAEMIFRAEEFVRAIQRYRKERGVPPAKLEDLMEPGPRGQYYLRRLYKDPLVKDGKWGLLYAGPGGEVIDPNAPTPPVLSTEQLDQLGVPDTARARKRTELAESQGKAVRGQQFRPIGGGPIDSEVSGGRQLAGLPIAGVKTLCDDSPFRFYKGQRLYKDWLFTYMELEKPKLPGQGGGPGRGRQKSGQSGGAFDRPRGGGGRTGKGGGGGRRRR
jgi:type II secretory pathway pseudopilin PulG